MYIELSAVYWASVACAFMAGMVCGVITLTVVALARDTRQP